MGDSHQRGPTALTDQGYWHSQWERVRLPITIRKGEPWAVDSFRFQRERLPVGRPLKLLEVGCAASATLPVYARDFGYEVYGVDYDAHGAELTRRNLECLGCRGVVECDDFFSYARRHEGEFDVVSSFGLVEHFTGDTAFPPLASLLRPGGVLVTYVPNLRGIHRLALALNPGLREKHVIYDLPALLRALEGAGLTRVEGRYVGSLTLYYLTSLRGLRLLLWPLQLAIGAANLATRSLSRFLNLRLNCSFLSFGMISIGWKP
ncbi:MAG: class I SAM-dependent methyltransferase [Planctomycetes bacterium]|nr:class I SAM-dependent methyltransferase [Planctomycetota bacterium]